MTLTQSRRPDGAPRPDAIALRPDSRKAVVVGVDGSPRNRAAISWAMNEAETTARPLNLVSVLNDYGVPAPHHSAPIADDRDRLVLRQFAADISRTRPEMRVNYGVEADGTVGALLARSVDQGLLVVGKRGHGTFDRALIGSTSIGVAGRSRIPVVIVPDTWTQARHIREPVVVGVDPDEMHAEAVAFASMEATRRGVGLVVVQSDAPPATALLEAARTAQLLVLGRSDDGGPTGFVFGAAARAVLHHAVVPVVVVPSTK